MAPVTTTIAVPTVEGEERDIECWASAARRWIRGECVEGTMTASLTATGLSPPLLVVVGLGEIMRLASRRWSETMAMARQGLVSAA
uniref:Uncharacterized protein n=1 Tax=Oryza punctata TaxID=4537 RepID=A0A0E0KQL5_ORYPU